MGDGDAFAEDNGDAATAAADDAFSDDVFSLHEMMGDAAAAAATDDVGDDAAAADFFF